MAANRLRPAEVCRLVSYFLENPNGSAWKIADGDRSGRWTLFFRSPGATWRKVASYTSPGAAALAVGSGDTGIHEWDDVPRSAVDFDLDRWQRDSAAA
jgi:hypothetical protein